MKRPRRRSPRRASDMRSRRSRWTACRVRGLQARSTEPARALRYSPRPWRRDVPRLRGRALELHGGDGPRRRAGRAARRPLRRAHGRPGGHRHAQLPGVGHRLRSRSPRSGPCPCRSTPGGPPTSSTTRSRTAGPRCSIADIERVERSARGLPASGLPSPRRAGPRRRPPRGRRPVGGPATARGGRCPRSPSSPDHDATILYTSGTTGHPKGAVSTHRAVVQALHGLRLQGRARPVAPAADRGRGRGRASRSRSSSSCRSSTSRDACR